MFDGVEDQSIAPPNPEIFASGTIINGFTPVNKMETDTLCMSIKQFGVKIVLVIDNEKLEKDIQTYLKTNNLAGVIVVKVPKSPGIQSQAYRSNQEVQQTLFNAYQDYFRGKHHDLFLKTTVQREDMQMP